MAGRACLIAAVVSFMGILNLTDNSFVRDDRMGGLPPSRVVERAGEMLAAGADIIDIGACSTAPGNSPVDEDTETRRLERFLPPLFRAFPAAVFSIDSFRYRVLSAAYATACRFLNNPLGQFIVNDVSSGADRRVVEFAASEGLCYIATDTSDDPYGFFTEFSKSADKAGLERWILDPGFGFGKTVARNWEVLNGLGRFLDFGRPVLAALSRKRMIWEPLSLTPDTCQSQSVDAEKLAIAKGASIIRTHDLISHLPLSSHSR